MSSRTAGRPTLWHLILALLAFAPLVFADYLFAGCYSTLPSGVEPPGGSMAANSDACSNTCATVPKTHSYFNATSGQCFCSSGTPWQGSLQVGNENACGNNYDNRNIRTTFHGLTPQCYAAQPVGINAGNTATFTGLNGCLNSCKTNLRATFWANRSGNNYYCSCVFPSSYGAGATCGPTTYFGYYHSPEAAASGLTRRKQRELAKKKVIGHCPREWTACLVDARDEESFECVDTSSELESCGGCLHGQYKQANSTVGTDCSAMRGVALGAATCMDGKCVVYACKPRFKLVDGVCR